MFEIGDDQTRFAAPPDSDKVYRVVRIGETEVVLHRGGETTVLKLHPEAETRPRR